MPQNLANSSLNRPEATFNAIDDSNSSNENDIEPTNKPKITTATSFNVQTKNVDNETALSSQARYQNRRSQSMDGLIMNTLHRDPALEGPSKNQLMQLKFGLLSSLSMS